MTRARADPTTLLPPPAPPQDCEQAQCKGRKHLLPALPHTQHAIGAEVAPSCSPSHRAGLLGGHMGLDTSGGTEPQVLSSGQVRARHAPPCTSLCATLARNSHCLEGSLA